MKVYYKKVKKFHSDEANFVEQKGHKTTILMKIYLPMWIVKQNGTRGYRDG